jgi:hypothetical protein
MDAGARLALERTREALAAALADIDRQLGALDGVTAAVEMDCQPWQGVPLGDPRWLTTTQAIVFIGRTESTVIRWCIEHGIGEKFGGRWWVWKPALDRYLSGQS